MSLWQIAARNVWQSRGRYVAYLASAAFSVMIYFLYSALIYHPELQSGYRGAGYVVEGMKGSTVVIAIFTFLFLLYSNSAFVRSRMKEFGLLSLLGLSRGQLIGLILFESLIVGAVAVAGGMTLGLLFMKLFFMAISALVRLPEALPFYAGPKVWLHTLTLFGSFFVIVSLASLRSVLRRNIIGLVRAGRQPKGAPTFSRWKTALGLILLLGGYAWASIPNPVAVILGIMPVTAMVSVGTILLMREGSIAFLTWLHKRERFFYRPGPFLNVSQLVYKMQDNYQVLSSVAILVAVILTAVGTAFTLYVVITGDTLATHPHAVQVATPAGAAHSAAVAQVEAALEKHGVTGLTSHTLVTRKVLLAESEEMVTLVPYSFYAGVERQAGETLPLSGDDQAIKVLTFMIPEAYRKDEHPADRLVAEEQSVDLTITTDAAGRITNTAGEPGSTLVVSDATFAALMEKTPVEQQVQFTFWDGPTWRSGPMQQAAADLRTQNEEITALSMTVEVFHAAISSMGLVLFIGVFISLVFFAACFSLLYFRLFTEIDEDRRYFRRLQQVGVSSGEMKSLALKQAAVIFFVPFVGGLIHSTFAMKALGTVTSRTVLQYGWGVALCYLVLYGLCFGATCTSYWRSLQAGLGGREGLAAGR